MADPQWYRPQPIDILIGGQHYWDLVLDRTIRMGPGLPVLKQSVFGWLVVGEIGPIPAAQVSTQSCCMTTLESIDNTLKRFWEIKDAAGPAERKDEDEQAEKIYQETITRDETGRFIVHLPLTKRVQDLPSNKPNAARQLYFLERKLRASPDLRAKYEGVFAEYQALRIIEKVPKDEIDRKAYYLPYHGVYKESSTTTKLRVVFNASSKSKNGLSLNDTLLTGPLTQPPLIETLWRFRQHQWALTCDITKMYLQFLVTPEQRDYHRFLWRTHKLGEVEEYRFRTLCFGVASSPYLATRSLIQLASEDGDKFPAAQETIRSSFYVDDCLVSADSIEQLQQIKSELIELLAGAGLQLNKWTSNAPSLCGSGQAKDVTANVADNEPVKTLGLLWNLLI
ncbi:uncharacterized protein LOC129808849 [Phlebotomus papatasi]|uniref:uncharacterized protein LOC129808849 n=1 Tax=Phlebotomus papatasi TaxID=29031 RepID=UPI002484500F|nr:uncharacterized protein LOC129808849 [Phlebotomus papatasi]